MFSLGFRVRKARLEDLSRILVIETSSYDSPWGARGFVSEILDVGGHRQMWVAAPSNRPDFVAAYVCFHYLVDQVYILNFTVAEAFRRKGLGKALLALVLRWARRRGCVSVALDVRTDNLPAVRLYRQAGFEVAGECRAGQGHSAWRMFRKLSSKPLLE